MVEVTVGGDVTETQLLMALANQSYGSDWNDGWVDAFVVGRGFPNEPDPDGYVRGLSRAPSAILVGQRLSRLAREGKCEKRHYNGAGEYRPLLVRFCQDDPMGLWHKGDISYDLGDEAGDLGIRLFLTRQGGEVLSLERPFGRGLVEWIEWRPLDSKQNETD